ncbi:32643_t:CDS:10 [Gigaspora margarita]|uniref:32643_t:CDS:1 n=1 Tax=Gigaspora margarita TaxID=4874 RepID=A0ABN7UJJ0_GIGMA|nr:32643_t:CDS:10 [Gigaspora margarita]
MSREELTEVQSQQTTSTSTTKESRENVPTTTTAPKKTASSTYPSFQGQQSQNEPSSTADSSQEIKANVTKRQREKIDKDISIPVNAHQGLSDKDITTTNNISDTDDIPLGGSKNIVGGSNANNGVTEYDQENVTSVFRRQSINGNSQSNPASSSSASAAGSSNTATISNNTNNSCSNGTGPAYDEIPQMYQNLGPNTPFIPVSPQYFTPTFFSNNGQYYYDPQYRFGRPPQIPPPTQHFVRSNIYPYHPISVIPPIHPPSFHSPPLIQPQSLPARYLNTPSTAGGDSGFSSRRSSLDQARTPDLGPQHTPRISQQKKPKQLDKALWVGNLPDSTTHEELMDFFTDENMESVFLIKKSNCAFVNYKTHDAVMQAACKYNESEFKGIKLVCRPRKQTPADLKLKSETSSDLASDNTPPPTPSEAGSTTSSRSRRSSLPPRQRIRQSSVASMSPASSVSSAKPSSLNRYFILKSLTQDDLDISVKSGFWATQPHNEAALNKAFKSAENVYLIFSANKSGEFYGYAKMVSPISKETTETVQWTPIDEAALAASSSRPSSVQEDVKTRLKKQKLPFMRTRHLRNPWNANREVKISRDGTEVEPIVGERLIAEFHKTPPSTVPAQYMPINGPLITQPLNIDNQSTDNDAKDRRESLSSQSGASSSVQTTLQPVMDPNYIQSAQPTFFSPPGYWHPQHMIMPPFSTGTSAPGYIPTQQAWTTSVSKDSSGVSRIQPPQSTGVPSVMPLEQQYVETPVHQHHYPSAPAHQFYPNNSGNAVIAQYQQTQHYYRNSEEQYQATSQPQQEPNSENVPYLVEEQRKGLEATSSA